MIIYQDCDTGKCYLDNWRECDKMGNLKMTREEAIKIMESNPSFSGKAWIDRFEALGLIKFDEPKLYPNEIIAECLGTLDFRSIEERSQTIITKLKDHGYKIERI